MSASARSYPHVALFLVGIVLIAAGSASGAVICVRPAADGANDGTSWADALSDLQTALATAVPGDEIWVAAGTYTPAGPGGDRAATFQLKSGVAIYGGFQGTEVAREERNPDPETNGTVLSGDLDGDDGDSELVCVRGGATRGGGGGTPCPRDENSYHVVTGSGADETAVLDGFVIIGGYANGPQHMDGAGMINVALAATGGRSGSGGGTEGTQANPTVINCMFEWNFASRNGGGDLTLSNCTFRNNHAEANRGDIPPELGGGGLSNINANLTISDCTFNMNTTAGRGAEMHNWNASPTIIHSRFDGNKAIGTAENSNGGAIFTRELGIPMIVNCSFTGNVAKRGGGMAVLHESDPIIVNCTFSGNVATSTERGGGGMYVNTANVMVINCTFSGNVATTVGAAIEGRNLSQLVVRNCILWGNVAGGATDGSAQISGEVVVPSVNYSCVQGGVNGGVGNISLDPLFVDADGPDGIVGTPDDDLRLMPGSPCFDEGDDAALPADTADLDGDGDTAEPIPFDLDKNPRLFGLSIDMGAFESSDCNGNGVLDTQDIADGTSQDCSGNGVPDECEADCNVNGIADSCDIAAGTSADTDADGVPDSCQPQLVGIMDEPATGLADTFISPRNEDSPLSQFTLEATENLVSILATSTYTGPVAEGGGTSRRGGGGGGSGPKPLTRVPTVVGFTNEGGGQHVIELNPAPARGECLKLSLRVRGASTGREAVMNVWLAHHPDDINQDGTVDIRDATAFGEEFRGQKDLRLVDLNGDGVVDVRDATTFGDLWHGRGGASQPWNGSSLPNKPQ